MNADLIPDLIIDYTCPICDDGGEPYPDGLVWACDKCGTLWDRHGRRGYRQDDDGTAP